MIQSVKVVIFSACMVLSSFVSHAQAQSVCVEAENPVSGNRSNSNLVSGMEGQYNGCYGNEYEHSVYNVTVPSAGPYTLKMRFSSSEYPYAGIIINGGALQRFNLGHSGSWNTFTDKEFPVTLNAGTNTIRIQGPDGNVGYKGTGACFNLDNFCVTPTVNCPSPIDGSAQAAGMYSYDNVTKCMQVCDGTKWIKLGGNQPNINHCIGGSLATGPVQCWGNSGSGGTTPSPTITAKSVKGNAAGAMCAIKADDSVQCWGNASNGGTTPSPTIFAKSISGFSMSGGGAMCAIKTDDTVQCWGNATRGGTTPSPTISAKSLIASDRAVCAIKTDDTVQCWGEATYGGTTPSPTISAKSLHAGLYAICAIKTNDDVQCWGNTFFGPGVTPSPTIKAKTIVGGAQAMCAIKTDDTVQCWGQSSGGGSTPSPTISAKSLIASADADSGAMCAVKMDNTVQCWGESSNGGSTPSPTISAKSLHNANNSICAIKTDNTVQCWGCGACSSSTAPSPTITAMDLTGKATENNFANTAFCAIKADNTVQCWGHATFGGTTPSPIIAVHSIAHGGNAYCAIKK